MEYSDKLKNIISKEIFDTLDDEIKSLIVRLNSRGFKTTYSCAGFDRKPSKTKHSLDAYVSIAIENNDIIPLLPLIKIAYNAGWKRIEVDDDKITIRTISYLDLIQKFDRSLKESIPLKNNESEPLPISCPPNKELLNEKSRSSH